MSAPLQFLEQHAHPEGGWAYGPGALPQVEPTCFALLALRAATDASPDLIAKGIAALRSWQSPDGAFRVSGGGADAVWPTALTLFTLTHFQDVNDRAGEEAAAWLLAAHAAELPDQAEYRRSFDIDPALKGWSWADGTFAWSEPTAWAVLALTRAGLGEHPRVVEGRMLLLDRTFDNGGINCGNKQVFGQTTDPVPATSALLLLAFAGQPDHPRLAATRRYLRDVLETEEDLENLCWIKLALDAWGETPAAEQLHSRIENAHKKRSHHGLFAGSTIREALTLLALQTDSNCFLAQLSSRRIEVPDGPPAISRGLTFGQRLQSAVRGMAVQTMAHLRAVPAQSQVHIAAVQDYHGDIAGVLREQFAAFRAELSLKGKRVVLKPNLVEYHRDKVINTHPHVLAAAIELCRSEGAREVLVAEGPGHWRNAEYLVTASGLADVLRLYGTPFLDLNHDSPVKTPNLGRLTRLEHLYLAETIATADVVISLPKLKTHHWAGVTLSLKNMFGALPGICYGWPKNVLHWQGISESIVDIAMTRPADLAIVDGIVGMEGDGPLNGTPVPSGVLVMGTDLLAVDATCCRLMQLDPAKVNHLRLGAAKRLGHVEAGRIQQMGLPIQEVSRAFDVLPKFDPLRTHTAEAPPAGGIAPGRDAQS